MGAAPWVGITAAIDPGRRFRPGVPYLYAARSYALAVAASGAVPVLLVPGQTPAEEALARCDALVLSGGDQLPTQFGAAEGAQAPPRDAEAAERIDWERGLIDEASARRIPVLGVCYGMQLLNLHFGGSLRPGFLPEADGHGGSGLVSTHAVETREATRVAAWVGARAEVASSHHQAIDRVASSFRVAATSPEGVVEAIESKTAQLIGIEWHPELDATGPAIYGALVELAREAGGSR